MTEIEVDASIAKLKRLGLLGENCRGNYERSCPCVALRFDNAAGRRTSCAINSTTDLRRFAPGNGNRTHRDLRRAAVSRAVVLEGRLTIVGSPMTFV